MYPGSESPKSGRQKRQRVENGKEGKVGEGRRRAFRHMAGIFSTRSFQTTNLSNVAA